MTGKIDEKNDDRLTAKKMKGVIGLGNFLPDFEKGISGMKQGEIKTFMVKFPNNYLNQV
ncbi:MAG: hypothetical protein HC932_00915 [Thermales bacterium]|nr:hypothetical protein [Thermales bacterium]